MSAKPSRNRNPISTQYDGASADPSAPAMVIAATSQYTCLRPITLANRPNTNAPAKAANSMVELSTARWPGLRFQSLVISGTVTINHATCKLSGQVTGGSGAYQGDTGTITGRALRNGAILTLTYHH